MNILILCDYFFPGKKAGGPIQSVSAIVESISLSCNVSILTRNHDYRVQESYPDIKPNIWVAWKGAHVKYLDDHQLLPINILHHFQETNPDICYLNSFFSPAFTVNYLLFRKLGLIPHKPLILAPRGEFSVGALKIKSIKKRLYTFISRVFGLYKGVIWHLSSDNEANDLKRYMLESYSINVKDSDIFILPPLKSFGQGLNLPFVESNKELNFLKIVFVSRISKMKNLLGALKILKDIKGNVIFDIFGPKEDLSYWMECQEVINQMPPNCQVTYKWVLDPSDVVAIISKYDLFFLPTLGENFGHVILEALVAGRPVLISDRTRWIDLAERKAGWSVPIEFPQGFVNIIEKCIGMSTIEYSELTSNAWKYGQNYLLDNTKRIKEYALMFEAVNDRAV